jgi:DNA-binding transcriptional LysR family regulator
MHIHARALVSFDMIRRAGSIRAAARHLHITASAVNRQLLLLEEEVGTPLFERLSSGLQLTSAGEAFARHVITVLQDSRRLANELDALQGIRRGSVSVIAASGLMSGTLPALLGRMGREHPLVDLTVNPGSWEQCAKAVADGEVDVAIGFSIGRHAALRQVAVGRLAFGAVVSPDHPIATLPSVTFAECARHPLILPTPALMTHAALQPLLRALKRPCKVVLNAGSIDLMKAMAAQGAGISFQNRIGIEDDVAEGRLVYVPLRIPGKLYSEIGVYVRAERALPPAVNAFVQFASEEIDRQRNLEP